MNVLLNYISKHEKAFTLNLMSNDDQKNLMKTQRRCYAKFELRLKGVVRNDKPFKGTTQRGKQELWDKLKRMERFFEPLATISLFVHITPVFP
ncbi:CLUMA_CG005463, isoform A [Clunio marinus]|uniref:CLUMA_CG005463, isoform A n=1 Tax=Clunio marinus TaxID=568069 RepID=A0A1J1I0C5_9DIPT|nr:CLUMA_CG005463, isoform A [Clunio marinus]